MKSIKPSLAKSHYYVYAIVFGTRYFSIRIQKVKREQTKKKKSKMWKKREINNEGNAGNDKKWENADWSKTE